MLRFVLKHDLCVAKILVKGRNNFGLEMYVKCYITKLHSQSLELKFVGRLILEYGKIRITLTKVMFFITLVCLNSFP